MVERMVVIGGDAAGMSAASQARKRRPVDELEIIALERSNWVSYSACGEPYYVAGYIEPLERLLARRPEVFAQMGIEVRTRHEATAIDIDTGKVSVTALDSGNESEIGFDTLMIGTGARPLRPPIRGADLPGVFGLHTLDDAAALRRAADEGPGNAVVVGGGYVGLEAAEAFHSRGWKVTVLTSGEAVLDRTLDPDLGARVVAAMEEMGIRVVTGTRVECINGTDRVVSVGCDDETHPAEVVVLGLGFRPESGLATEAGIGIGPTGAIAVDDRQRTDTDGVWAGGDCAEAAHRLTGLPVNFHLGTVANKAGRVAGINIGGGDARFPGVLGTAITKVCDLEISSTGLRPSEAAEAGLRRGGRRRARDHRGRVLADRHTHDHQGRGGTGRRTHPGSPGGGRTWRRQADRRVRHRHLERDDRRPPRLGRPRLRPSLLGSLGLDPHSRPPRRQADHWLVACGLWLVACGDRPTDPLTVDR